MEHKEGLYKERELLTTGRWNLQGRTRCGGDGMMKGCERYKGDQRRN